MNLKHLACKDIKDKDVQIPINAYLIHHKKYGYFLIDSGCEASYTDNAYGPMKGWLLPFFIPETDLRPDNSIENQIPKDVINNIKGVFLHICILIIPRVYQHYRINSFMLPEKEKNLILLIGRTVRY